MHAGSIRTLEAPHEGRFSFASWIGAGGALVLVLSWLTTEHFLPWVSWHAEVLAFAALFGVALAVAFNGIRGARVFRIRIPALCLPFALLAAVACVQVSIGTMTFMGDAIAFCFYMALAITSIVLGFNSAQANRLDPSIWSAASWVALAFLLGALASVVVALAQVFQLWEHSAWVLRTMEPRRPGANVGQPNQLATLLVTGIASAAYLHLSGKMGRTLCAVLVLLLCAGVAMSESRSGAVGLLALLAWWQYKRKAVAPRVSGWVAPVLAAAFVAMSFAWPHVLTALQLAGSSTSSRFTQGDMRVAMWSQLLEAVWQRPWWGWGVLQVAEAHNAVAHAHHVNNPFSFSHNLILDLAVWMGLPIALGLSIVAGWWGVKRARSAERLLPWYCIAAAIPLLTHSMLELPFAYAYFLAPVLFLLGVLEGSMNGRSIMDIGSRAGAAILCLLVCLMLWSVVEYLSIEEDFRIVRFEQLRIGKTPAGQGKPDVILLTQLGALLDGSRVVIQPGMSAENIELLRKLAMRYPWVATQYRYALALALNGDPKESVRQFQVLRWQRDEKTYASIKRELAELGAVRYPQLQTLNLP